MFKISLATPTSVESIGVLVIELSSIACGPPSIREESIYKVSDFINAKTDVEYAYNKAQQYIIPSGMNLFRNMFEKFYEN